MRSDSVSQDILPELARFAWCGLVALRLAQQQGRALSDLQQRLFLMQWLASAQKQKRFPKCVASDIAWLLMQGKKYGFAAKLSHKLDYLYRSTSGVLELQSDLFRLTYFLETLKPMDWQNEQVTQEEWTQGFSANASTSTVYAAKALLESNYNEAGQLLTPMSLRFAGDTGVCLHSWHSATFPINAIQTSTVWRYSRCCQYRAARL
ncbi:DUF2913 family protein [Serratia oryzae]|uniref:DUF2913 family protein n=1 Tax=Serratia oryzae TaxID=2034155 RepID=UPI0012EF4EE0|nr:DUF2913 family protein [Serratia oryzae]VXD06343.1 hypothetical protein YERSI8AC_40185 [Enterobacterales bacterium 8AC]